MDLQASSDPVFLFSVDGLDSERFLDNPDEYPEFAIWLTSDLHLTAETVRV